MALFLPVLLVLFFFFNDTATTEIYTLSLHDALPICRPAGAGGLRRCKLLAVRVPGPVPPVRLRVCPSCRLGRDGRCHPGRFRRLDRERSEEHTSELQSRLHLVCRLLLEKKKKKRVHTVQDN